MKYKIETEEYADTHTVDGVSAPVIRTRRVAVPVLPRDWDALSVRAVVGLVLALTAVSITWSTVSIAHLLKGTWTAYLAGGVFDLAWCAALGMAYLVRFRLDRRAVVDRVGWALLTVTVTAIGLEGYRTGGLAMACIGASVSIAAKALWWTLGHATRPELNADDAQWVAAQISAASAQLAVASVRRQVARAQDRVTAELLAIEASRRPPVGTVPVDHATGALSRPAPPTRRCPVVPRTRRCPPRWPCRTAHLWRPHEQAMSCPNSPRRSTPRTARRPGLRRGRTGVLRCRVPHAPRSPQRARTPSCWPPPRHPRGRGRRTVGARRGGAPGHRGDPREAATGRARGPPAGTAVAGPRRRPGGVGVTGGVQADLRRLPWWATVPVVLLALAVLGLRAAGLVVALIVSFAERLDVAVGIAAGISPLGASTVLIPPDLSAAFRGGAR